MNKGDSMKKKLGIIWNIIQVVIIIFVILVTIFVLCKNKYGYTEIANYNFSYTDKNELLIIKKTDSIKEKDNIYYYDVYKNKYVIRNDKVTKIENSKYYISESTSIEKNKIIGKSDKTIPVLGKLLSFLESKLGFILFVIIPLVIIFIYQIFKFVSTVKEERKEIEDNKPEKKDDIEVL